MTASEHSDSAPGWEAVDAALHPLYPDREPKHYGTLISYRLGGPDPLQGISAYRSGRVAPHWHFVTYGFSELYDKESEDSDISGYGFELTFRLADDGAADEPPAWAMNFLQNLARYVFDSGNVFQAGHYMNLNGPIALGRDTAIGAIAFVHDPELTTIDTPNGRVEFLQVVGITEDEERALKRWSTLKALATLAPALPLYITDLERASALGEKAIAEALRAGAAQEGSSTGMLFTDRLSWTVRKRLLRKPAVVVTMGARQVEELASLLPLRLPFDAPFTLLGHTTRVSFAPGPANDAREAKDGLDLVLDAATCRALIDVLRPVAGAYPVPGFDRLSFEIRKTEIRDGDGHVVRVIG